MVPAVVARVAINTKRDNARSFIIAGLKWIMWYIIAQKFNNMLKLQEINQNKSNIAKMDAIAEQVVR